MKKTIFLTVLCVFVFSGMVFAHPATNVTAVLENPASVRVTAMHQVKDAMNHYIDSVKILVNGEEVISQKLFQQTSADSQSVLYVIPGLKTGDKIEVVTECNKGGEKTGQLLVP